MAFLAAFCSGVIPYQYVFLYSSVLVMHGQRLAGSMLGCAPLGGGGYIQVTPTPTTLVPTFHAMGPPSNTAALIVREQAQQSQRLQQQPLHHAGPACCWALQLAPQTRLTPAESGTKVLVCLTVLVAAACEHQAVCGCL